MKRILAVFLVLWLLTNAFCAGNAQEMKNAVSAEGKAEREVWYLELNSSAGWLYVEWKYENPRVSLIRYDAAGRPLRFTPSRGVYHELFELSPETVRVEAVYDKGAQSVRSYRLYGLKELPADVQNWDEPYEKCDLMLIVAHQDDEWLWFGGMIPYYELLRGKNVTVVYMADCGRDRTDEALAGLWEGGLTHSPVFLGLRDEKADYDVTLRHWGGMDAVTDRLTALIRRYRPEVIVTHGLDGEYGHNQHVITAQAVEKAVARAAEADEVTEGTLYGAWQVKKLYRHEAGSGNVTFDWTLPVPEKGDKTLFDIAAAAYGKHVSQRGNFTIHNGGEYDNRVFTLVFSAVGRDRKHDDLFENVG